MKTYLDCIPCFVSQAIKAARCVTDDPRVHERVSRADLIISKGQGNFEILSDAGDNIAFWFKVKCPGVSGHVGRPMGTHALLAPGSALR